MTRSPPTADEDLPSLTARAAGPGGGSRPSSSAPRRGSSPCPCSPWSSPGWVRGSPGSSCRWPLVAAGACGWWAHGIPARVVARLDRSAPGRRSASGAGIWTAATHSEQVLPRRDSASYLQTAISMARDAPPRRARGPGLRRRTRGARHRRHHARRAPPSTRSADDAEPGGPAAVRHRAGGDLVAGRVARRARRVPCCCRRSCRPSGILGLGLLTARHRRAPLVAPGRRRRGAALPGAAHGPLDLLRAARHGDARRWAARPRRRRPPGAARSTGRAALLGRGPHRRHGVRPHRRAARDDPAHPGRGARARPGAAVAARRPCSGPGSRPCSPALAALWLSNQYLGTIAASLVPLVGLGCPHGAAHRRAALVAAARRRCATARSRASCPTCWASASSSSASSSRAGRCGRRCASHPTTPGPASSPGCSCVRG